MADNHQRPCQSGTAGLQKVPCLLRAGLNVGHRFATGWRGGHVDRVKPQGVVRLATQLTKVALLQQRCVLYRQATRLADGRGGLRGARQITADDGGHGLSGQALGHCLRLGHAQGGKRGVGRLKNAGGVQRRLAVAHKDVAHPRILKAGCTGVITPLPNARPTCDTAGMVELSAPVVALPAQWLTLSVASANLLNLALPGHVYYPNQAPYGELEYERKVAWLGAMFERVNADVVGVQEVWDEPALKAAVARSGLRYTHVLAPGAQTGAVGTPCVGLVSRHDVLAVNLWRDFPAGHEVQVPELGEHRRFERGVLQACLRTKQGLEFNVLVTHLKSKRPKFLQDAQGNALEDRDDPAIQARATLRSLIIRGAEAAALRTHLLTLVKGTRVPLILFGDMNDGPHSVTSQMIAANQTAAYDKGARDSALYHAPEVQTDPGLKRDLLYSHVHQGWPEMLDQIWVSEEFVATSRFAQGDVRRVEVFNDHLHESRERFRSDHGFVRALLRWRSAQAFDAAKK
jgi:endonuclease/exonuclease/phosphatase family metal-dependent hydrolase